MARALGLLATLCITGCTIESSTNTNHSVEGSHLNVSGGVGSNRHLYTGQTRSSQVSPKGSSIQPLQSDLPVELTVDRILVARDVKQRRIVGEAERFPNHIGSLWSLAAVYAKGGAAHLEMRWWYEETLINTSPFVVSEGIRWREWSQITVQPKAVGHWRVEVFYPRENRVLRVSRFKIVEPLITKQSETKLTDSPSSLALQASASSSEDLSERSPSNKLSTNLTKQSTEATSRDHSSTPPAIKRLVIARSIKHRRPHGVSQRFRVNDERLWGYIEVTNLETPSHVWMEWRFNEELRSKLKIRVGVSRRWRTWSWQRLNQRDLGRWEVRVSSAEGQTLAQTHFIVDR